MPLILEVSTDGALWKQAAVLHPGDQNGSVSDRGTCHRDVIMFRCEASRSVIYTSDGGLDYTAGSERAVVTLGTTELAVLTDGETFERAVTSDRGASYRVRWRHAA